MITALIWFPDQNYRNIGNRKATTAAYLDLAKAFKTIDHALVLVKLKTQGINSTAYDWFKYLNRTQQVCIGGQLCAPAPVTIGALGSVLGPLAFILFNNDLPKTVKYLCMPKILHVVFFSSDNPSIIQYID